MGGSQAVEVANMELTQKKTGQARTPRSSLCSLFLFLPLPADKSHAPWPSFLIESAFLADLLLELSRPVPSHLLGILPLSPLID